MFIGEELLNTEKPIFTKFPAYRPHQSETITQAIDSDEKVVMIEGPTGSGKSLAGMSIGQLSNPALYLCTTKSLQDQLADDFTSIPMVKGRANYPCQEYPDMFPQYTADDCPLEGDDKKSCKKHCPYEIAKRHALRSPLAILNTSYFITEANYVGGFAARNMVVVDEADRLEDTITKFVEISVSDRMIDRMSLDLPRYVTVYDSWVEWAGRTLPKVTTHLAKLTDMAKRSNSTDLAINKQIKIATNFHRKLSSFSDFVTPDWIYQTVTNKFGNTYQFKPIWLSTISSPVFWDHASKFVLMSATILSAPDMANLLGIPRDYHYLPIPSQFDPARRQVIYRPVANLTHKTSAEEFPHIIEEVQRILDAHPDSKGLIHTVSYSNARKLVDAIRSPRFVTHDSGPNRQAILEDFKRSPLPLVLISPSMDRGIDLPDDQCRFIIIVKVPYADLGDKQVQSRFHSGPTGKRWYVWSTACTLVQMTGRGMRHESDQCTSYILDRQFERFYGQNGSLFPKWWSDALVVE
jgi:ATP-dependent DNA helicase DinG